jgi:hypothetical protein
VRISNLLIDSNGQLSIPTVYSKKLLIYSDSIGEGSRTLGLVSNSAFITDDLIDNDSRYTWCFSLGEAVGAEVSVVSYANVGFVNAGAGNIPPVFIPNNDASSSWNKFDAQHSRLVNGGFSPIPDYIVIGLGTNDKFVPDVRVVMGSIYGFLGRLRSAVGRRTFIFGVAPFGGQLNANITTAYQEYLAAHPDDKRTYFIDNGPLASVGINQFTKRFAQSADGIHPLSWRSQQLGSILAGNIAKVASKVFRNNIMD